MKSCKYLIVGGGMTADSAVDGIREVDGSAAVTILGDEPDPPYDRPPLSKGLWKDKSVEDIWRGTEEKGVELISPRRASKIDVAAREVTDSEGDVYRFERLLLATGGRPRRLPFDVASAFYYRTLEDYRALKAVAEEKTRFAVIGGGFIGSEVAAALAMRGKDVTMVFPEAGVGGLMFPSDLSMFLNAYYTDKGVRVIAGEKSTGIQRGGDTYTVQTEGGDSFEVDTVVAGIGIEPNTELAANAGLDVDNGIVVDGALRTAHPDIFAAGDVANFHNPLLDTRMRVEHEDNANTMGALAGANMAGASKTYDHLPFFYSDMFDLGYEAVGVTNSRLKTVVHWEEPHKKGVIFYLHEDRVRGAVFWNVWDAVDAGRDLIAQPGPFDEERLRAWVRETLKS